MGNQEDNKKSFRISTKGYGYGKWTLVFLLLSIVFGMYADSIENQSFPIIAIVILNILPIIFSLCFIYYFISWIIDLIKKRRKVAGLVSVKKEPTDNEIPVPHKQGSGSKPKVIFAKLKNWKYIIIIALILSGLFYWYELRPTIIRGQCSWFTYTTQTPYVPAQNEITKDEYQKTLIKQGCTGNETEAPNTFDSLQRIQNFICMSIPKAQPARPAVPAGPIEKITRSASETEYRECLRHDGINQ